MFASVALIFSIAMTPLHLRLRPSPEGDLLGWLVAGPFPSGFDRDYLAGEASVSPVEEAEAASMRWRFAAADFSHGLDLKAHFRTDDPGVAYAYTSISVPNVVHARLRFGSDDGAKVFLNGTLIFNKDVKRGVKRDEEEVPLDLRAGANRLLFKIEQYDGGWGLMARIVDAHDLPIPGLVQALDVNPSTSGPLGFERGLAGKPGSFDIAAYQEYGRLRMAAQLFADRLPLRAGDPERLKREISVVSSSIHESATDADHANVAVHAGLQRVAAAFRESRLPLLQWAQNPGPLALGDPQLEDFVRVSAGGRYFAHADGRAFVPIGANHNLDWPELEESNPLGPVYDPARTDRWFARLHESGVNVIRLMAETPPSGNLEEKVGTFRPEHVIWLDHVFEAARKHDVKLWITPYDTFWMSLRRETSPYWHENGGPIDLPIDFLTKPEIIEAQERRMKFLIDRYGNSGTVFAWEIMNEIDLWWGASPEQIKAWTDQMAAFVRGYEHKKWGRNHMLTISFADAEPKGLNAETAFRRPDLDFATMHLYLGASRGPHAGQAYQAGVDFASGVTYARGQVRDNRPVLDGESGPIDHWIAESGLDDEVFHQMSWQHLMAGGAGPGTRWPYRHPHVVSAGMLATLASMRNFCDGVPWGSLAGQTVGVVVRGPMGAKCSGMATADGVIAWVQLASDAGGTCSLDWKRLDHSAVRVRVFDVKRGKWLGAATEMDSQDLRFSVPAGVLEVAVWVAR